MRFCCLRSGWIRWRWLVCICCLLGCFGGLSSRRGWWFFLGLLKVLGSFIWVREREDGVILMGLLCEFFFLVDVFY